MQRPVFFSCLVLLLLSLALPALAILNDSEDTRPVPNDADYAAGLAAMQRADWQAVLDSMARVVARRPWDDDAYNLMGFASRKLGNYRQALAYYQKALDLNPHHRGALEYLGETYLEMRCVAQARDTLMRLEAACKRITGHTANDGWKGKCQEWTELHAAITTAREPEPPGCPLQ
jgi:tetratricopeptide (TPR) repeat protein